MTTTTSTDTAEVRSLEDAQALMRRQYPCAKAPLQEWQDFYQRGAELYAQVAEIDAEHRHEALYEAQCHREDAESITESIARQAAQASVHRCCTAALS